MKHAKDIDDVGVFLALSYVLETESADRYADLADVMEVHNDSETAGLFRRLSGYSEKHAASILDQAKGTELPSIANYWEFEWSDAEGPETTAFDSVDYMMAPVKVLELALHNERRGCDFYAAIADRSPNKEVQQLAAEFAAEESEHVELIEAWIGRRDVSAVLREDPDPPHMPE